MKECKEQNNLNGFSLAAALSATVHSNARNEQLVRDNYPGSSHDRVFAVHSSSPPPLEDTIPAFLISWPVIEENA